MPVCTIRPRPPYAAAAALGAMGGTRGPQKPERDKGTHPVCHPFCGRGSGWAEIRALTRGTLERQYVCLVPLPVGWAATMTRASAASQPRGRISREPVPAAADNELSDNWRRLCLHPAPARGTRGPSGRSNRKFSRERKRAFVLESLNFHCRAPSC